MRKRSWAEFSNVAVKDDIYWKLSHENIGVITSNIYPHIERENFWLVIK